MLCPNWLVQSGLALLACCYPKEPKAGPSDTPVICCLQAGAQARQLLGAMLVALKGPTLPLLPPSLTMFSHPPTTYVARSPMYPCTTSAYKASKMWYCINWDLPRTSLLMRMSQLLVWFHRKYDFFLFFARKLWSSQTLCLNLIFLLVSSIHLSISCSHFLLHSERQGVLELVLAVWGQTRTVLHPWWVSGLPQGHLRKTNNLSRSTQQNSQSTTRACLWTVGRSLSTWVDPMQTQRTSREDPIPWWLDP